jgi:hypothetical protein
MPDCEVMLLPVPCVHRTGAQRCSIWGASGCRCVARHQPQVLASKGRTNKYPTTSAPRCVLAPTLCIFALECSSVSGILSKLNLQHAMLAYCLAQGLTKEMRKHQLWVTAIHECGHALAYWSLSPEYYIRKVCLVSCIPTIWDVGTKRT